MEQLILIEPKIEYANDIWKFRREILEYDVNTEDQFAGCVYRLMYASQPKNG